jgi:hypothetical protein
VECAFCAPNQIRHWGSFCDGDFPFGLDPGSARGFAGPLTLDLINPTVRVRASGRDNPGSTRDLHEGAAFDVHILLSGSDAIVDERGRSEPEGMAFGAAIADDDEPVLSHATKLIIAVAVFALGLPIGAAIAAWVMPPS